MFPNPTIRNSKPTLSFSPPSFSLFLPILRLTRGWCLSVFFVIVISPLSRQALSGAVQLQLYAQSKGHATDITACPIRPCHMCATFRDCNMFCSPSAVLKTHLCSYGGATFMKEACHSMPHSRRQPPFRRGGI